MFKIISIMFVGLGTGYLLRDLKLMRKTEKTIPLTVFAMLFILGMSVGSNSLIVSNLGRFSGQAALLACFSVLGSIIAAWYVGSFYSENVDCPFGYDHRNVTLFGFSQFVIKPMECV